MQFQNYTFLNIFFGKKAGNFMDSVALLEQEHTHSSNTANVTPFLQESSYFGLHFHLIAPHSFAFETKRIKGKLKQLLFQKPTITGIVFIEKTTLALDLFCATHFLRDSLFTLLNHFFGYTENQLQIIERFTTEEDMQASIQKHKFILEALQFQSNVRLFINSGGIEHHFKHYSTLSSSISPLISSSLKEEKNGQCSQRVFDPKTIQFEPNHPKILIPGLEYFPNYVTEEEEAAMMNIIDSNSWSTAISRRQQHYGIVYYHTRHNLASIQPVDQPDQVLPLTVFEFVIQRLMQDGFFKKEDPPTQCLVNEYVEQQRIASHVDNPDAFGDVVVSLSLVQPCYMTMRLEEDESQETRVLMERRSLLVLRGDARFKWKHGITAKKHFIIPNTGEVIHRDEHYRRISLTFRKLLEKRKKLDQSAPVKTETCTW